jgi:hypothetical protein
VVRQLNSVSNKTYNVVDFWLNNVLGGYITKFAIDCTQSYNVAKRDFFNGPHGRFMKSLDTWIKMLLCDKCMMTMVTDC